jgi:uncharacterized OsmC-like protein
MKANVQPTGKGVQMQCESRGFKFILDEPQEAGGMNEGMNPLEGALCATGACLGIVAASFAQAKGFTYESFSIDLEGDVDPDGFMGIADVPKGFQAIRFNVNYKTSEPQEKCDEFTKFMEETCPLCCTFAEGVKVTYSNTVA